jgi:hypothetical protein
VNKLIALCYFVLSLYGCDVGGSTFVHRTQVGGTDTLYIERGAQPGVARFDCLRSASGRCYYTLFPRECAPAHVPTGKRIDRCPTEPVRHFAIANGGSHQVAGLQRFRMCVSAEDGTPGPDCGRPEPIAAR